MKLKIITIFFYVISIIKTTPAGHMILEANAQNEDILDNGNKITDTYFILNKTQ